MNRANKGRPAQIGLGEELRENVEILPTVADVRKGMVMTAKLLTNDDRAWGRTWRVCACVCPCTQYLLINFVKKSMGTCVRARLFGGGVREIFFCFLVLGSELRKPKIEGVGLCSTRAVEGVYAGTLTSQVLFTIPHSVCTIGTTTS